MSIIMSIIAALTLGFTGNASPAEVEYAIDSLLQTGVVLEDSILFDCALHGNQQCS